MLIFRSCIYLGRQTNGRNYTLGCCIGIPLDLSLPSILKNANLLKTWHVNHVTHVVFLNILISFDFFKFGVILAVKKGLYPRVVSELRLHVKAVFLSFKLLESAFMISNVWTYPHDR